jgi:hypothetical protein
VSKWGRIFPFDILFYTSTLPFVFDTLYHPRGSAFAALRSRKSFASFSRNSADVLKKHSQADRHIALMYLSSFRIAVIRLGGTPIAFAGAFAVKPSGFKNSSLRIPALALMQAVIQRG